jgi:DNA-binding CsgD family transcriptional regulator
MPPKKRVLRPGDPGAASVGRLPSFDTPSTTVDHTCSITIDPGHRPPIVLPSGQAALATVEVIGGVLFLLGLPAWHVVQAHRAGRLGATGFLTAGRLLPALTDREREILTQIARHLNLSPKTVRNHVSNIFTKLRVADRAAAIAPRAATAACDVLSTRGKADLPAGSARKRNAVRF